MLRPLSHLSLSVIILSFSLFLILAGTLVLPKLGLYFVQKNYFEAFFVWKEFKNFSLPIFPGGMLLGVLFGLNLLSNFVVRFKAYARQPGLFVVHFGILILCVGVFLQVFLTRESQMVLTEGKTSYYSEDLHHHELVFIRPLEDNRQKVLHVPHTVYQKPGNIIPLFDTPFHIRVKSWHPNAVLRYVPRNAVHNSLVPSATQGAGAHIYFTPMTPDPEKARNLETLVVDLYQDDTLVGTYLFSNALEYLQKLDTGNESLQARLRPRRYFEPSPVYLKEFVHEKYAGTNIPRHFSSHILITDPGTGNQREVHISMNQPLRFYGSTYYQASFGQNDTVSILQVVRNQSAPIPYFSCALVTLGLIWHFCQMFWRYQKKRTGIVPG